MFPVPVYYTYSDTCKFLVAGKILIKRKHQQAVEQQCSVFFIHSDIVFPLIIVHFKAKIISKIITIIIEEIKISI